VLLSILFLALAAGVVVLLNGHEPADGSSTTACLTAPTVPSLEIVYRLEAGRKGVTPRNLEKATEIVCKRLHTIAGMSGEVRALGENRIRVVLPQTADSQRVAAQIGVTSPVYFYDWEPNLIGPEQRIGGHPGEQPPAGALTKAKAQWRAARRNVNSHESQQLIYSGAFPTAYEAALLAAKQPEVANCVNCSTGRPRYYLFARKPPHRLIAGPEDSKRGLYVSITGNRRPHDGFVVKVPAGTVLISERPTGSSGKIDPMAQPGWFALRDRPALSGADITEPKQNFDPLSEPSVTFAFTKEGRKAFQSVTRKIAHFGRAQAVGPVRSKAAAALSGHFAVDVFSEVKVRPIVNFVEFPNGIDGRTGAEISGFNNIEDAQELVTVLKIGTLPINATLIRWRVL
jgi:SecD/SecF fusion protein